MQPRATFPATLAILLATAGSLSGEVAAQDVRYELGLRVRAFESAFETHLTDLAMRDRACEPLATAVQSFFGIKLDEVARHIDRARRALEPDAPDDPVRDWAESLSLRLDRRFVDLTTTTVEFELLTAYAVDAADTFEGGVAPHARLRLRLVDGAGKNLQQPFETAITEVPLRGELPLKVEQPGDHTLLIEISSGNRAVTMQRQVFSCARNLDDRMAALASTRKANATSTPSATARGLARMLRTLARGGTRETDIFATRHLGEVEALAKGQPLLTIDRPGDFRVWLHAGNTSVANRLLVPKNPKGRDAKIPLVLALHGAGGSENLFFDAYGAGKIVRLCEERGWLLLAPRAGLGRGADPVRLIEALAEHYPVDRQRVYAVGHSMGAGMLMRHASSSPTTYRAIALLGGGGSSRPSAELQKLPIFLAPGDRDFARNNARRLRKSLELAKVEELTYREYENTEHFGIVQVALDDVFAFFDRFVDAR